MGTSRNDRSPNIPPWKPVFAVLGKTDETPDRQLSEIWRGALGELHENLIAEFAQPSIATACSFLSERLPVGEALERFDALNQDQERAGLGIDLGRRALARCAAAEKGPREFVGELFAEATSYYVSRDLPSFVAGEGRVATTTEAIALKASLRKTAKDVVVGLGEPKLDRRSWSRHIERAVVALSEGKAKA